jgi:ESCRT-I complex subunit VPS37
MYKSNQEPDIPAALGLLSHLNNDELKELLNNDGKFEDIVKDIEQVCNKCNIRNCAQLEET